MKTWREAMSSGSVDGFHNYMGEDYGDTLISLGRTRDSGLITESNFRVALKMLGGESDNVFVVRVGHWACGWLEWIGINPQAKDKVRIGEEIEQSLANYPILDDIDYSQLRNDRAVDNWQNMSREEQKELLKKHRISTRFKNWYQVCREDITGSLEDDLLIDEE